MVAHGGGADGESVCEFAFGAADGAAALEVSVAQQIVVEQALVGQRTQRGKESVFDGAPESQSVAVRCRQEESPRENAELRQAYPFPALYPF